KGLVYVQYLVCRKMYEVKGKRKELLMEKEWVEEEGGLLKEDLKKKEKGMYWVRRELFVEVLVD
uniref:hypothetical protein n=1 Tax=Bacillus altitudinis TaxID=293387 RepID=UPI001C92BF85